MYRKDRSHSADGYACMILLFLLMGNKSARSAPAPAPQSGITTSNVGTGLTNLNSNLLGSNTNPGRPKIITEQLKLNYLVNLGAQISGLLNGGVGFGGNGLGLGGIGGLNGGFGGLGGFGGGLGGLNSFGTGGTLGLGGFG